MQKILVISYHKYADLRYILKLTFSASWTGCIYMNFDYLNINVLLSIHCNTLLTHTVCHQPCIVGYRLINYRAKPTWGECKQRTYIAAQNQLRAGESQFWRHRKPWRWFNVSIFSHNTLTIQFRSRHRGLGQLVYWITIDRETQMYEPKKNNNCLLFIEFSEQSSLKSSWFHVEHESSSATCWLVSQSVLSTNHNNISLRYWLPWVIGAQCGPELCNCICFVLNHKQWRWLWDE